MDPKSRPVGDPQARLLARLSALVFVAIVGVVGGACTTTDATTTSDPGATTPAEEPGAEEPGQTEPPADGCAATCKTGCCAADGSCKKSVPTACGAKGAACVDCTGNPRGDSCWNGECGCNLDVDCPKGDVCDPYTHQCGKSCKTAPCAKGCCSPNGVCQNGDQASACGGSGTCLDCSKSIDGPTCIGGGKCGCNTSADCPTGRACDTTAKKCVTACSDTQRCNGGCCGANGQCTYGTTKTACGNDGGQCNDCSGNGPGTNVCAFVNKGGVCGCSSSSDCPVNMACDTKTKQCTSTCNANQNCNRGCCDLTTSKCEVGNQPTACGDAPTGFVGTCAKCSALGSAGPVCLPTSKCGCAGPADCPGRTCQSGKCCSAKDAGCAVGADCCSGVCIGINGVKKCG